MRPEESLHLEQIRKFGKIIRQEEGAKTTKDGMYGGVATWDRQDNTFQIHKSGRFRRDAVIRNSISRCDSISTIIRYESLKVIE